MGGTNSKMKIKLKNESKIETIDSDSENIRSRRGEEQIQICSKYMDEILNSLNLRWYQKLYLKFMLLIK